MIDKMDKVDQHPISRNSVSLIELAAIAWRWRKFILSVVFVTSFLAIVLSLLLPKWYRATTSILPPKQPDFLTSLGSSSSVLKSLSGVSRLGGLSQKSSAYNYFAVLKSRGAMEDVIRRFDLIHIYEIDDSSMEKAVRELENNVAFEDADDDYITVEVLDRDPRRAADMANYFVEVLNKISIQLGTREAQNNREFVEKRLFECNRQLREAEELLKSFQEKKGIIMTPEQTSSISAVASLYGMKTRKEVELAILKRGASNDNPAVQQVQVELAELQKKLSTFPGTGLESFRLYREVLIQQKIVEFLVPLYEQARIDEQKDVPVILVLDKAVPPEKKARPRRLLLVALVACGSLLVTSFSVLTYELGSRSGTWLALKNSLRSDKTPKDDVRQR